MLDQRKADRDKARDLQTRLDAVQAEREEADRTRLAEQARFKELYETEKKKASDLDARIKEMTQGQIEARKREAIKAELGGVRKDDYLKFADLSAVQVNDDGSVDTESVRAAANKFREAYPELVTGKAGSKLPNEAGSGYTPPKLKPLSEMSPAELREAYQLQASKQKRG